MKHVGFLFFQEKESLWFTAKHVGFLFFKKRELMVYSEVRVEVNRGEQKNQ